MITKVQNNPEDIYVASGYKEIGKSFELNRQRVTNIVYGTNQATINSRLSILSGLTSDNQITDAEKPTLQREMENIYRTFVNLKTQTANADLGDSDEYQNFREAYERVYALMYKIVTSSGTYVGTDVKLIDTYYTDFTDKANTLQTLIINTTTELDRISSYYAMTKVNPSVFPESVAVDSYSSVSASILYDGVEKVADVPVSAISFSVSGMAVYANTSQTTVGTRLYLVDSDTNNYLLSVDTSIYPDATMSYSNGSCSITGTKSFRVHYYGIGDEGVNVNCAVVLDSGSMPF